jgi:sulfate transport system substrate-binding protein
LATSAGLFGLSMPAQAAETVLLNASYDVARELFKDINPLFVADWKKTTGETINVNQSHGGSSKQARSVADGMEAAVVTMNQANDIDMLVERGWWCRLGQEIPPQCGAVLFHHGLPRAQGNPQQIKDWATWPSLA